MGGKLKILKAVKEILYYTNKDIDENESIWSSLKKK